MRALLGLVFSFACGCAASVSPYARAAAGHIGCPAEHIELGRIEREGGGPEAWVAQCGHTAYACTSSRDPRQPQARVVCSELGKPRRACQRRY
jgi:hypothetical protein